MTHARTAAVLLAWNDGERVVHLLERLLASSDPPDRILVVDNGSVDGSAGRIRSALPDCEVIELDRNFGFARAANVGIRRALELGAEWVWLLNSDVELPDNALALLLKKGTGTFSALGKCACPLFPVGMVGAVLVEPDGSVQAYGGGRVSLWTGIARHTRSAAERCDYLSGACLLLSAAMLREIGFFDEGYFFYWEDIDLGFRAREAGWKLAVSRDCIVVHDEGSSLGRWSDERWFHLFRGTIRFMKRRARFPRTALAIRLLHHGVSTIRHGRRDALAGAWRAMATRDTGPKQPAMHKPYPAGA